jgi:demethylmenaquinone methyltransferase/2-methoxy-6-polyprenyl-1,4-benzoquinol methylase
VDNDLLTDQLQYYRARAAEYDETSYGVATGERQSVPTIVDRLRITGRVLELACGSGIWTHELVRHASSLTAVDGAPEMLALAADRVPSGVGFRQANLFEWEPDATYDAVFFAAWLSHVPADRFDDFWSRVARALAPGGRAIALDELPSRSHHEEAVTGERAQRTLRDGTTHEIVKIFWEPPDLIARLASIGWTATVEPIEYDWFVLQARREH